MPSKIPIAFYGPISFVTPVAKVRASRSLSPCGSMTRPFIFPCSPATEETQFATHMKINSRHAQSFFTLLAHRERHRNQPRMIVGSTRQIDLGPANQRLWGSSSALIRLRPISMNGEHLR